MITLGIFLAALRIVSLAPSLTEDLFAIGAGPSVVGVDANSDRPTAAKRIPRVGALYGISVERVASLHPDLVVGISYQAPLLAQMSRLGMRTEEIPQDSLADDDRAILLLGALCGRDTQARRVRREISSEVARERKVAEDLPIHSAFIVLGTGPIFTAGGGSFLDSLLQFAHLENIARSVKQPWTTYSDERLRASDPAVIVVPSDLTLPKRSPWDELRAVRTGCVLPIASDDILRPGPNIARALRTLVKARMHC